MSTSKRLLGEGELTFNRQLILVAAGYLVVACVEITLHWLMAKPSVRPLLNVYEMTTPAGRSQVASIVDLVLPAIALGYWNAKLGRRTSSCRGQVFFVPLAVGLVALYPIYFTLLGGISFVPWWPRRPYSAFPMYFFGALGGTVIMFITWRYCFAVEEEKKDEQ